MQGKYSPAFFILSDRYKACSILTHSASLYSKGIKNIFQEIMKTSVIYLFIFFLASGLLTTQAQSRLSYGVKAGINRSSADHNYYNFKSQLGFHVGVIADYQLKNNFFLRSGVDFTTKGAECEELWTNPDGETASVKYNFNYLQLPVLLGYKIPVYNQTNIFFNAGIYLSYGIYAREKRAYIISANSYSESQHKGFDDCGFWKVDFGLVGGLGIEYQRYFGMFNYEMGVVNEHKPAYGGNPNWKNRNLTFSLGYKF